MKKTNDGSKTDIKSLAKSFTSRRTKGVSVMSGWGWFLKKHSIVRERGEK